MPGVFRALCPRSGATRGSACPSGRGRRAWTEPGGRGHRGGSAAGRAAAACPRPCATATAPGTWGVRGGGPVTVALQCPQPLRAVGRAHPGACAAPHSAPGGKELCQLCLPSSEPWKWSRPWWQCPEETGEFPAGELAHPAVPASSTSAFLGGGGERRKSTLRRVLGRSRHIILLKLLTIIHSSSATPVLCLSFDVT